MDNARMMVMLLVFRDYGIAPLVFGHIGQNQAISSETIADASALFDILCPMRIEWCNLELRNTWKLNTKIKNGI